MKVLSTAGGLQGAEISRTDLLAHDSQPDKPLNAWAISVPPGGSTLRHDHHDSEFWVVVAGEGSLDVDGQAHTIARGDIVFLEPLERHAVRNESRHTPLTFVSVWWDSPAALARAATRRAAEQSARIGAGSSFPPAPILLPAFPTPNGDLHLGHLSGPYLGADVYSRCAALHGVRAATLLGSIGHMNHVAIAAQSRGESYYQTAERFTDEVIATLDAYRIGRDVFVRPTPTPEYCDVLTDVFMKLKAAGLVSKREDRTHHCDACARFCFEAEVSGACPHCGSHTASANDCEGCARYHADHELKDAHCRYCGGATTLRDFPRYFVEFEAIRPKLRAFVETAGMPDTLRRFGLWVLSEPLPPVVISHMADFGVPVPDDPLCNQRIASTFEHGARLLEALRQLSLAEGDAGLPHLLAELGKGERSLVVFFGWDNAYMRVILFPALLIAYLDGKVLPHTLYTNRFLTLEGSKFSTGRNHAIWGRDMLERAELDPVRFYLALTRSEGSECDFREDAFRDFLATHYHGTLGRWLASMDKLAEAFERRVPEAGPWDTRATLLHQEILAFHQRALSATSHEGFSPRRLAQECLNFATVCSTAAMDLRELLIQPGPLVSHGRTVAALCFMALRSFTLFVSPLAPALSVELRARIGLPAGVLDGGGHLTAPAFVEPATPIQDLQDIVGDKFH